MPPVKEAPKNVSFPTGGGKTVIPAQAGGKTVIPAQAGIQCLAFLGSRLRGNDESSLDQQ
jgi:hypothetical protein